MPFPSKTNQEMILVAATEIVERQGIESLSMREIARRLELAPNALYHYYQDRNELEAEIAAEGFRQLFTIIKRAANRGAAKDQCLGNHPDTVVRTSLAYLKFARTRPALYQLMIKKHTQTPGLVSAKREIQEFSKGLFNWLNAPELIAEANFAIFAMIHGIATLEREGLLEDDLKRDPAYAISALLAGLSKISVENKRAPLSKSRPQKRQAPSGRKK